MGRLLGFGERLKHLCLGTPGPYLHHIDFVVEAVVRTMEMRQTSIAVPYVVVLERERERERERDGTRRMRQ